MKDIEIPYTPIIFEEDVFGRTNCILIVDKPVGITSHDVVYYFRKKFNTKKVGHAGTLDPFASGALIILIGKYTKDSSLYLEKNKVYKATILFGVKTNTYDIEGDILDQKNIDNDVQNINLKVKNILKNFSPFYLQTVPIFSSVKVNGNKLRILARKYDSHKIILKDGKPFAEFYSNDVVQISLPLPQKKVFLNVDILDTYTFAKEKLWKDFEQKITGRTIAMDILVNCSKGTYIRSLAYDIGVALDIPAMLIKLRRVGCGDLSIDN